MADSVKVKITGDAKPFNDELDKLGKKAKNAANDVGQKAQSVFKGMMASQIVTKGLSMLTGGLRSAITTGMQFEAAMSQVAAISGATGAELEMLTETAKRYGETTMFSASQAAEALNYMALAGWDAQQSTEALGGVLDLAAASGMDLGAAADAVTDYLSAFSMEASQAGYMADLMAYAQSKSNTTAAMLADAYGNCATSMHGAGQDIETTTAMLMALANQGIKGSEAGTQMAAVMRDLTSKMADGRIMIGNTAVQVTDASGNFRDLTDILIDVGKATEGLGTAEASAALMETFTARSVKAVQTILNEGVGSVEAYEEALRGSAGTAAEQAEAMMDNLQGDVQIFKSALEGLQITASESTNGMARGIVQEATEVLNALTEAGKHGGLSAIADEAVAQIPKMLPKVVKGVEGLLKGVGQRLPSLVKGMIGAVPDMLEGAADLVPQLTDSLFDAASGAVEGLVTNLPRLVPMVAKGVFGLAESALLGAGKLVAGLFTGIDSTLLDLGLRDMRLGEKIQAQIDGLDMDRVAELSATITTDYTFDITEPDVTPAVESITGAIGTIKSTIEGLNLTDQEKSAIIQAVLRGSGYNALVEALAAMGVTDADAKAAELVTAVSKIQMALSGLGNPQAVVNEVYSTLAAGGDQHTVEQVLMKYGASPVVAGLVAGSITAAGKGIEGVIRKDLGLPQTAVEDVYRNLANGGDAASVAKILESYGVDPQVAVKSAAQIVLASGTLSLGIASLSLPQAAVSAVWTAVSENADAPTIEKILESYGVESSVAKAKADEIKGAATTLQEAVSNLGLPQDGIAEVMTAVSKGQDTASIAKILEMYDVPAGEAWSKALQITLAASGVNAAIGTWQLPQAALDAVYDAAINGKGQDEISAILQSYNVPADQADAVAQTMTDVGPKLAAAAKELKIPPQAIFDALTQAQGDKAALVLALGALGLKPEDYKSVVDSYDEAGGSIAGGAQAIFEQIKSALTDGLTDVDPVTGEAKSTFAEAKQAVDDYFAGAREVVTKWQEQELQSLKDSGLEGTALQQAIDAVNSAAEGMIATIDECEKQANTFLTENANQSKDFVKDNLNQLEGIVDQMAGVQAKIDALTGQLSTPNAANANRFAVEQGAVTDRKSQAEAITYSAAEYKSALDQNVQALAQARAEAAEKLSKGQISTVEYNSLLQQYEQEAQQKDAEALATYQAHMAQIVQGIMATDTDTATQLAGFQQDASFLNSLSEGFTAAFEEHGGEAGFDLSSYLADYMGLTPEAFQTAMADMEQKLTEVGLSFPADGILEWVENQFRFGNSIDSDFYIGELFESAFADVDVSGVSEALMAAMQAGDGIVLDENAMPVDASGLGDYIMEQMQAVGEDGVSGFTGAFDDTSAANAGGERQGGAVIGGTRNVLQSKSPSKAMALVGQDAVAGLEQGLGNTDGVTNAATALGKAATTGATTGLSGAEKLAQPFASGLASGILSGKSKVIAAAIEVARAAAQAVRDALQIHSPSRVTAAFGENFDAGLVSGIRARLPEVRRTIEGALSLASPGALRAEMDAARSRAGQTSYGGDLAQLLGELRQIREVIPSGELALNVNGKRLAGAIGHDMDEVLGQSATWRNGGHA